MQCLKLGLVALCLQGCLTDRARERGRDRDSDGHTAWQLGGSDCDDENPAVNPDRPEVCGNGLDDNCDGLVDDSGEGNLTWFIDADGDGYTGSGSAEGCSLPNRGVVSASEQLDCDDGAVGVHPDAMEVWYDGVDQNCDGNDQDQDGDGSPLADDCDDLDARVRPGAVEVCNNGLDDDCSGPLAGDCGFAETQNFADERFALLPGQLVMDIADQNQDGHHDIVVLRGSDTLLFRGPFDSGTLRVRDAATRVSADAGLGCRLAWLFNDPFMSLVCADLMGERIQYSSIFAGGSQPISSLSTLVGSPVDYDQLGSGFGVSVFSANDAVLQKSVLFASTGQYQSEFGVVSLESGVHAFDSSTEYPINPVLEQGGPFQLDFDIINSRPLLFESGGAQYFVMHEQTNGGGQLSLGSRQGGSWEVEPFVVASGGDVVSHSQPMDIDGDGELDFLSLATRQQSTGAIQSSVSVHYGPVQPTLGEPIDVAQDGVPVIVSTGGLSRAVMLSTELCDVDGDDVPEIVLSTSEVVEGRLKLDLRVHNVATGDEMFEIRSGGLVVGCRDFDGNGADDIVATDITQSWILFSDLD